MRASFCKGREALTLLECVLVLFITSLILLLTYPSLQRKENEIEAVKTVRSVALNFEQYNQRAVLRGDRIQIRFLKKAVYFIDLTNQSQEVINLPENMQVLRARTLILRPNSGLTDPLTITFMTPNKRISLVYQMGGGQYVFKIH